MAKIAFIQEEAYEKLSVMILSAVLKERGHQTEVFISELEKDFYSAVVSYNPDIVAFSVYFSEERFALSSFQKIKELLPDVVTVVGGPFFFISQEMIEDKSVDIMIKGDGEKNLPVIVDRISSNQPVADIAGVSYKENGSIKYSERFMVTEVLDDLPMHDRDIYPSRYKYLANQSSKYFIHSRGCPYKCTFCGNSSLTQEYRSAGKGFRIDTNYKRLFNEINYTKEKYDLKWVQFVDGTFNASKKWIKSFLKEYIKAKMPPFICTMRIEGIDEEMVGLLKSAGCDRVTIGLQSSIPRIQKIAGRLTTNDNILKVVRLIQKYNIRISIDMIIGWPGETLKDIWESIYFVRQLNPDFVSTNLLVLFPDTEISKYAYENHFITRMPAVDDFSGPMTVKNDSTAKLKVSNEIKNLEKLFEFAVFHPHSEPFVKSLAMINFRKVINMIHYYPSFKRSFKYDHMSMLEKLKKIQWFISL